VEDDVGGYRYTAGSVGGSLSANLRGSKVCGAAEPERVSCRSGALGATVVIGFSSNTTVPTTPVGTGTIVMKREPVGDSVVEEIVVRRVENDLDVVDSIATKVVSGIGNGGGSIELFPDYSAGQSSIVVVKFDVKGTHATREYAPPLDLLQIAGLSEGEIISLVDVIAVVAGSVDGIVVGLVEEDIGKGHCHQKYQ